MMSIGNGSRNDVSTPARLLSVLRRMVDESADTTIELSMRDGNAIDNRWRDASVDLFLQCGVAMRNTVKAMEICMGVRSARIPSVRSR